MTPDEILDWIERGKAPGCKDCADVLGDKPELAYSGYRATLAGFGHQNTTEYIYRHQDRTCAGTVAAYQRRCDEL